MQYFPNLVILDILFLISLILVLRAVVIAKFTILSSIFLILASYTSFLATSYLVKSLSHLIYLNQQEQLLIYQHPIYLHQISN